MTVVEVRTVAGVDLVRAGTWAISTGEWTVGVEDLAAAVEAHRAGVLRKPVIHLGHDGPMGDASPALGFVDHLRLADGGSTLVGDLVGVPAAVARLLPHAYPDRSVEALVGYEAPDGRVWPLVLTGLALLGATAPGVSTLRSLQDVGALYGEAVAASRRIRLSGCGVDRRAVAVAAARRRRSIRTIDRPMKERTACQQ